MYEMNVTVDIDTSLPVIDADLLEVSEHNLSPEEFRAKVMDLQNFMLENVENVESPVTHHFAPGNYAREMFIPKDRVLIGKIHRHAHLNIISKGKIYVVSEFGSEVVEAPCTFVGQPGVKRCGIALEDTIWTTIHPTDETDLAKIEQEVIAPDYDDLGRIEGDSK